VSSHRASRPSRRSTRLGGLAAVVVGLLLSGLLIWTTSYAAYSATTQNAADTWSTCSVSLTDDRGSALFTVDELWPGATGSRCITVISTGTVPGQVRLYGKDLTGPALLTQNIHIDVTQGTAGTAVDCSDFTASSTPGVFSSTLAAYPTGYSAGGSSWDLAGTPSEQRTYRITYTVDPNTGNENQDMTASMTFVWEVQTNAS
jgi:hypothetical protein